LILQFGEPIRVIETPGIKFKVPFLQDAIFFDKRIIDLSLAEQEVIASDQKRLIINAFVKYQITNPLKFYTTVNNVYGLSSKLSSILDSSLRQIIGGVTLSELLTENRVDVMKKIRDVVSAESEIFGIKIVDVRIMRADLPKENSDAIFARMQTEREKEAREIRANGAEEADKIRAEADKQKTIILAEAKKKSDLTRGNGEAEAAKIYANSYGRDPEFADFYRSMNAYKEALHNDKTKMVISSDSEFFKYFGSAKNQN
jgi:membrane protease subunit HflC